MVRGINNDCDADINIILPINPNIKAQRIDHDIVNLELTEGAPIWILQADNRKLHKDFQGTLEEKKQVVRDRVKVLYYEKMGEVPEVLDVEVADDGTVANITIA